MKESGLSAAPIEEADVNAGGAQGQKQSVLVSFVKYFGEDQAKAVEAAAEEHANGPNNTKRGSDPFRWAITIAIGYQCMEKDGYRKHHGITPKWDKLKAWIKRYGNLAEHDGDMDYLALLTGVYNEYVPKVEATSVPDASKNI